MIREETISLGIIVKLHALKGEFLIQSELKLDEIQIDTEWVFFDFQGQPVPFFIQQLEISDSSTAFLKVEDIDSFEQGREWIGHKVLIPSSSIKETRKPNNSLQVFKGFEVHDQGLGALGKVDSVMELHNNPILRIIYKGKEVLIPINESIIIAVDHKKKLMHIKAPDGLVQMYLEE